MPALSLGDSDAVQTGDTIYTAGNAQHQKGIFQTGVISAILPAAIVLPKKHNAAELTVFQINTPVLATVKGGPVLNTEAEVIGMVSTINVDGAVGTYAVPINYVKALHAEWVPFWENL